MPDHIEVRYIPWLGGYRFCWVDINGSLVEILD